jgi:Secretion system C-terminal sorting domain
LNCKSNSLSNLSLSGFTSLFFLDCSSNQLSNLSLGLNFQSLVNLSNLNCSNNNFTSLDFSNMLFLSNLNCRSQLSLISLITDNCPLLNTIDCSSNFISNLSFSTCPALATINCSLNALITLDVSSLVNLGVLNCSSNAVLTSLFIKNGQNETLTLNNCPALLYICADDNQIASPAFQNTISASGLTSCVVNSFCTDTPGGSYNAIKGQVVYDSFAPQSFIKIKCVIGSEVLYTTTDEQGKFAIYTTEAGNFTLSLANENESVFNNTNPLTGNFTSAIGGTFDGIFSLTQNEITPFNDVEMMIAPRSGITLGATAKYIVSIKNKGNQTIPSGTMTINVGATSGLALNTPINNLPDQIALAATNGIESQFSYSNLLPFESRSFEIGFNVNSLPTSSLNLSSYIDAASDQSPTDNPFSFVQNTGVFNPNSILCLEGNQVPNELIGKYLHYVINIENTGTALANTIVIESEFDEQKFDVSSLQIIGSTLDSENDLPHPVNLAVKNNKATYSFRKAGTGNGSPGGQGGVLLKIKTKNTLLPGSSVTNGVSINFEYDQPITANEVTTFSGALKVLDNQLDKSITVYPNPTAAIINVTGAHAIQSVQVYDVQGRLLQTNLGNTTNYSIDLSNKAKGVYFIKVNSEKGMKVERVVKE